MNFPFLKHALRNIAIGTVIICVAGILFVFIFYHHSRLFTSKRASVMYGLVIVGLYGSWKLVNGLVYLINPKSEERSITDISN